MTFFTFTNSSSSCHAILLWVHAYCTHNLLIVLPFRALHFHPLADPCELDPCSTNGICRNNGTDFHCVCIPGYIGLLCEVGNILARFFTSSSFETIFLLKFVLFKNVFNYVRLAVTLEIV